MRFTNLLYVKHVPPRTPQDPFPNQANPFNSYPDPLPGIDHPVEHAAKDAPGTLPEEKIFRLDDQVATHTDQFRPQGLELVGSASMTIVPMSAKIMTACRLRRLPALDIPVNIASLLPERVLIWSAATALFLAAKVQPAIAVLAYLAL